MSIIQLPGQMSNPRQKASKSPQAYMFRFQELQEILSQQGIEVPIITLAFV